MKTLRLALLILMMSSTLAMAKEVVTYDTGYGQIIGVGEDKPKATKNARINCGTGLIDRSFDQRGTMSEEALAEVIDYCTNLE